MVEGTILHQQYELGLGDMIGDDSFKGKDYTGDEDYATLLNRRETQLKAADVSNPFETKVARQETLNRKTTHKSISEFLNIEAVPDMLASNERMLKSAYRHPFEYINPRLYQKNQVPGAETKFFVEHEDEYLANQGAGSS